jgi:hypothetical protein
LQERVIINNCEVAPDPEPSTKERAQDHAWRFAKNAMSEPMHRQSAFGGHPVLCCAAEDASIDQRDTPMDSQSLGRHEASGASADN